MDAGLSPAAAMAVSPSDDMVGPSPVTSNGTEGTETTDIEDDASEVQESPLEPLEAGEGESVVRIFHPFKHSVINC
jgi:hypothetical protein